MGPGTYDTIVYEKQAPIAFVTLNRPDKLNALSDDLQLEVRDALEDAGWRDDEIRVIVLRSEGRAFSAGFDITAGSDADAVEVRESFLEGKGFSASGWWDVFLEQPKADHRPDPWVLHRGWPCDGNLLRSSHLLR